MYVDLRQTIALERVWLDLFWNSNKLGLLSFQTSEDDLREPIFQAFKVCLYIYFELGGILPEKQLVSDRCGVVLYVSVIIPIC